MKKDENKQKKLATISLILGTVAFVCSAFKMCADWGEYSEKYAKISGKNYIIEKQEGTDFIELGEENYYEDNQ